MSLGGNRRAVLTRADWQPGNEFDSSSLEKLPRSRKGKNSDMQSTAFDAHVWYKQLGIGEL